MRYKIASLAAAAIMIGAVQTASAADMPLKEFPAAVNLDDGKSDTAFFQSAPAVRAAIFNYGDLKISTARIGLSSKF